MEDRRHFLRTATGILATAAAGFIPGFAWLRRALAQTVNPLLPADLLRDQLIQPDPTEEVDASRRALTPLEDFGTMGTVDQVVDLQTWQLEIVCDGVHTTSLTYNQIQQLPAIEKNVLMICPGFFSNHGLWKGVSMHALLEVGKIRESAEKVIYFGANGSGTKTETFPMADLVSGHVFLAYAVNGVPLPRKHGFPLRVVAGNYYGDDWVKYVYKMEVL